ncbi:MAG: calcium/sodium antiporter [Bacteroidales bacterium]|nr:calcium/sodium antiporter [Bacteroidales bacterium]
MTILLYIVILLLSFYLIAQVSDRFFIPSLDSISGRLNIRSDVAGATLMAIGSSAPELFIALIAVFHPDGHAEIGMGTIVGSALFNVLAIIGAAALVRKAFISWQPVLRDTIFYLIAIVALAYVFFNDEITLWEAILLIVIYVIYIFAVIYWGRFFKYRDDAVEIEKGEELKSIKRYRLFRMLIKPLDLILNITFLKSKHYLLNFIISIMWIAFLSWVLVHSAIALSEILHIPESLIALTVLAIGTSVPDLISSVIVAKKGRGGMAISNALGSNIFDVLLGLGLPWLIAIIIFNKSIEVKSQSIATSVILLFGSVIITFSLMLLRRWVIKKPTGIILLALYVAYLVWEILGVLTG